jgi:hypothetical protein
MNKPNFLGMSGFYWWMGVVEKRGDPLNLGRVKVRIFGMHTDNLQLIPSEDLPWAHPIFPINNPDSAQVPKEGQWVVGFFMDGASCQAPAYFGVIPGIPQDPPDVPPQVGFRDMRTAEELANSPAPPAKVEMPTDGSGATVTSQPAKRFPFAFGFPSLPTLAINDIGNQAPEIINRIQNTVQNIQGPDAKNLADTIAAAGEGALSGITGAVNDAPAFIKSLLPDPTALASSINVSDLSTGLASTVTDALSLAKSTVASSLQQATDLVNSNEFKANLSKAQEQFQTAYAEAQGKFAEAQVEAQKAVSQGISDLSSQVNGIADEIKSKLSSLAGGNLTTQFPVNLQGEIAKVDISGALNGAVSQIGNVLPGALSDISSQISSLAPSILNDVTSQLTSVTSVLPGASGLTSVITEGASSLTSALPGALSTATSQITSAIPGVTSQLTTGISSINLTDIPLNIPLNQVDTAISTINSQISQLQSLVNTLGK